MSHSNGTLSLVEPSSPDHRIVVYSGRATPFGDNPVLRVHLGERNQHNLDPRTDLKRISLDGLSWGSYSPGAEQLALALLSDVLDNDPRALRLYPHLCNVLIQYMPAADDWMLADCDIRAFIRSIETIFGWNWLEKYQRYSDELPV